MVMFGIHGLDSLSCHLMLEVEDCFEISPLKEMAVLFTFYQTSLRFLRRGVLGQLSYHSLVLISSWCWGRSRSEIRYFWVMFGKPIFFPVHLT